MDVRATFFNGVIEEEEVYREKPQSFVVYEKDFHGYRLLGQSMIGLRGSLNIGSVTEREHESLLHKFVVFHSCL